MWSPIKFMTLLRELPGELHADSMQVGAIITVCAHLYLSIDAE